MKNIRTLAAAAASTVIAAALIIGAGLPANAATADFPPYNGPITPQGNGSNPPSLPPGTVIRPVVQLPTCENSYYPEQITIGNAITPGFHFYRTDEHGAFSFFPLISTAYLSRHVNCEFLSPHFASWVSTVAFSSSADNVATDDWYRTHAIFLGNGGAGGRPGTSYEHYYQVITNDPNDKEYAVVSLDGWWIGAFDHGNRILPYFLYQSTRKFMAYNPSRN